MITVDRDYGATSNMSAPNNHFEITPRRQVYNVTHGGDERLPFMRRSFMSFAFGTKVDESGKTQRVYIEDFDLVATIINNRLERGSSAPFADIVTTYDSLDGQFYWNTHYQPNSITFNLSTDGIEDKMLDSFLHWFRAGEAKELVLAEHPNRAIMARVASAPELSLLPFEMNTTIQIAGDTYPVKTTLYKGEITLTLVMDEPYWYAIHNILGREDTTNNRYLNEWEDANGEIVNIFASEDALKIIQEDGIPTANMIHKNMLLGNGTYAKVEDIIETHVWSLPEAAIEIVDGQPTGQGARINGTLTEIEYGERSQILMMTEDLAFLQTETDTRLEYDKDADFVPDFREIQPGTYIGKIFGPEVSTDGTGIEVLPPYTEAYFFYAGTAPAPTIISFTFEPTFNQSGYFISIADKLVNIAHPYNSFFIESIHAQELRLTASNIMHSYNIALQIMLQNLDTLGYVETSNLINEQVHHAGVRSWANALLTPDDQGRAPDANSVISRMKTFFQKDNGAYAPMRLTFNSKTGEAKGEFYYRMANTSISLFDLNYTENAMNKLNTISAPDSLLTDEQRYENLVTWGWAQYCISNGTVLTPPTNSTYEDAILAFKQYVHECESNGVDMPGIFTVSRSAIESSNLVAATEDVSDMLRSNNLILHDRNILTSTGTVTGWEASPLGRAYSHRIYHDFECDLQEFQIQYRYMYL